ncbi:MAG: tetratricopeptide repeat protein [Flavobacteriales bacterium]|nr:tetratricopeptide repeat protein [Flavobacteriales bacterium]
MSKKKQGFKEEKSTESKNIGGLKNLAIVFDAKQNQDKAALFFESFAKLRPEYSGSLEVLVYDLDTGQEGIQVFSAVAGTANELLTHALGQSKADYFLYVEADRLEHKFDLNDLFGSSVSFTKNGITAIGYAGQENLEVELQQSHLYIFDRQVLRYMLQTGLVSVPFEKQSIKTAEKLDIEIKQSLLHKNTPFFERRMKWSLVEKLKFLWSWYVTLPIREFKSKPILEFDFIKEESLYRMKFWVFALILLIGMPIAAYQAGYSGDEYVQYKQGKAILSWFANFGEVTDENRTAVDDPKYLLHYYGSSFDLATAFFNSVFGVSNEYEWRHVLNSLTGWLLILFCGLIAVRIAGWRAGLIAMFLVFVSPRILGHSWNNPKDIPFAMSYIVGLYAMILFFENIDKLKMKHIVYLAMAIGMSIGIRIGGLLLFAYLFLFAGLYYLWSSGSIKNWFSTKNLRRIKPAATALGGVSILGYVFGIILWPFALQDPISNPKQSLDEMVAYGTSIRQLFEGDIVWSDHLPWYYISKYILITTPIIVWLGVLPFVFFFFQKIKKDTPFWKFMVFFFFAFPIGYIIYKSSNVYGGWRHALFTYPPIAICAALGFDAIIRKIRSYQIQKVALLMLVLLAVDPLIHIFKNHPYQYLYFNEVFGGIDKANGNYETDYYYHSTKEAYEWLVDNADFTGYSSDNKMIVATNGIYSVAYYARNDTHRLRAAYGRYYERGNEDWDYFICANSYINQAQLKQGLWPPSNAVYTVMVDNTPICAVLKRKTKKDMEGKAALDRGDVNAAIQLLNEAILEDPMIEVAYLNLADAFLKAGKYDEGIKTCQALLEVYPNYDKAMYTMSILLLNKGDMLGAIEVSKKVLEENPKFDNAYYIMGIAYLNGGDSNSALVNFKKCLDGMPNFKPAYLAIADILEQKGSVQEAEQYRKVAAQL